MRDAGERCEGRVQDSSAGDIQVKKEALDEEVVVL